MIRFPIIPSLALIACFSLPVSAQVTQRPGQAPAASGENGQNEEEEDDEKKLEGVNDDRNSKKRWEVSLPGGEYSVRLGTISSVSKHSYVLNGTVLVTEVTVDTTGSALARFYFMEPITASTNFNALERLQKATEGLRDKVQKKAGTKADEMAQKEYPLTTHARTIEFRIMNEVELNALYSSLYRAWDSGIGRTFRIR